MEYLSVVLEPGP